MTSFVRDCDDKVCAEDINKLLPDGPALLTSSYRLTLGVAIAIARLNGRELLVAPRQVAARAAIEEKLVAISAAKDPTLQREANAAALVLKIPD